MTASNTPASTVEGINDGPVTDWLEAHVPALTRPLKFSLITGGHSNLTYRCEDAAGRAWVLRRPPLGHVLESAHDMSREHRIISALRDSPVPVAATHGLCQDAAINGADFYVMDFVDGDVLHDATHAAAVPAAQRRSIGEQVIDILADLHMIDPDHVGLGNFGRREGYVARQLKRWTGQWEATRTHDIPAMDQSTRLLAERIPQQVGASIVHGDFRLGNMIVADGKVRAILDWELGTLGDPLSDLGYLLNDWVAPDDADAVNQPSSAGGFPSRDELCARYTKATARDLGDINYYRAFSYWRLAAIGQGVYKRYLVGAMGSDRDMDLQAYKTSVENRAQAALELLQTG